MNKPFRPPTQLTARALAFYLASHDDAHRRLCPHELNVDPDTLRIEGSDELHSYMEEGSDGPTYNVHAHASLLQTGSLQHSAVGRGWAADTPQAKRISDAIEKRHQSRKDPKSLGQNLYDSVTMIIAYSKHIPNPLDVFASLSSSSTLQRQMPGSSSLPVLVPVIHGKRPTSSNRSSFTDSTNADAVPHPMNNRRLSEPAAQNSKRPTRRASRTNTANVTTEICSSGQRVHRITHVPNDHGHDVQSPKTPSPAVRGSYDGAFDPTIAEKFRLGNTRPISKGKSTPHILIPEPSVDASDVSAIEVSEEQPATMPVYSHLTTEVMDHLKDHVVHHRTDQSSNFNFVVDFDANRRFRPAKPFVNRSLYYTLGDSETLLKSFRDQPNPDYMYSPLPHLDAHRLSHAFRDWSQRNGALIFDSLYEALGALFRPPPEMDTQKSPRLKPSRKDAALPQTTAPRTTRGQYLSDLDAAHIVMICIHALTSSIPVGWPHTWVQVRKLRGWGIVVPGAAPETAATDTFAHPWLEIVDGLEYEPAVRLTTRLLQAIGTRRCYEHVLATLNAEDEHLGPATSYVGVERLLPILVGHLTQVEKAAMERRGKSKSTSSTDDDPGWTVTATLMEFLRTIIVKQWDGKAEINKWGSVGTAVTLMVHLRWLTSPVV